jgi:hypothetical protein
MKHRGSYFVLLVALAATGCSEKGGSTGTVSGTVTYNGQPVPVGTISFLAEDGRSMTGELKSDGTYKVDKVPTGKNKVAVQTPAARGANAPADIMGNTTQVKPVPIPEKYGDNSKSGLSLEVKKGTQTFDITLQK